MHAYKAIQRQPFHRAKRKLLPALTAVIVRLQHRVDSHNGDHFPMSQSPANIWEHGHTLTEYQVWVCYRVATHQLNLYFPGCDKDSSCKRHLACAGQCEGFLHILWDCAGASKSWVYITKQWARLEVSSEQLDLYKQAALSRSAPAVPANVRVGIQHVFPDNADIVGQAWTRIWWIACSVCITTLWIQRSRSIHKQDSASTEQEVAKVQQVLLRQLRAVAIKEQRRDRDVSTGVSLRLVTEFFRDTIVTRQPTLHSSRHQQKTFPGVLELISPEISL